MAQKIARSLNQSVRRVLPQTVPGHAVSGSRPLAPSPILTLPRIAHRARSGSGRLTQTEVLTLQRTLGNRVAARWIDTAKQTKRKTAEQKPDSILHRQAAQAAPQAVAPQPVAPPAAEVTPALLHQIGIDAINTYYHAAVRGIDISVRDMAPSFNWAAFGGGVIGSLIWAAACFETGGTAFAISLAGIGVGGAAQLPQNTSGAFSQAAETRTEDLVKGMKDQVTKEGDDLASQGTAASPPWRENESRMKMLRQIGFRKEHLTVAAGGLPDVDPAAITAATRSALLLKANAWHMGVIGMTGGVAIYKYDLADYRESHYLGLSHKATPVNAWKANFLSSEVLMAEGGDDALANIRKGKPGPMHIRDWPVAKTIVVPADTVRRLQLEYVAVHLDAANQIGGVEVEGIFKDYIEDNKIDRKEYARQVIAKVWGSPTSLPPDIP